MEKLFALDIGTRSIVGLIMSVDSSGYELIDYIQKEHKERAMLDGQIHHVPAVASLITEIRHELEAIHGPLKEVSVAAAGRALRTQRAIYSKELSADKILTKQDILHMELSAVQSAQEAAAASEDSQHYHCVGYSVVRYQLDHKDIGSLEDQLGDHVSVEIIATFLPRVVVESLLASLSRAGLQMNALTLEPIAAINVLIPPSMRRLNVALVDIGAGTSDIAISNEGTVTAYGMVPVAGDEISEALSDYYLLDFNDAEKLKRALTGPDEEIEFTDILGFTQQLSKQDIIKAITPAVEKLAESISGEMISLNLEHAPKAVMLVGGGSLTPQLTDKLAEKLSLPVNRVAVRGIEAIQGLKLNHKSAIGPELVTPAGIAIAANQMPINYMPVKVNGHDVRLFEIRELNAGDAVLSAGLSVPKLYGKPGLAKIVKINGTTVTLPGTHGLPPSILINGIKSDFDTAIHANDEIVVEAGENGKESDVQVKDLLEESIAMDVTINSRQYHLKRKVFLNGMKKSIETLVQDRDEISIEHKISAGEAFLTAGIIVPDPENTFYLTVDGKGTYFPQWDQVFIHNGQTFPLKKLNRIIHNRDVLSLPPVTGRTVADLKKELNLEENGGTLFFNEQEVKVSLTSSQIIKNGVSLGDHEKLQSGDVIEIKTRTDGMIFQDIFNFVEWRPPTSAKKIEVKKNGEDCDLSSPVMPGDALEVIVHQ
ncbi:cell division FtsA domain-containing protein [Jeotgalibacillus haloalkalitolerans]|uniref:Pilus assembly protein PilM n=1 Tax=Jeotgalibacillus haloalkalitolerans TaxID=3104292 RepID=A0ABU5KMN5_9BACL|nr:cell division FtsA domain-containing protein [Jeotgalibacillus sp. HH7-29]MDZ5712504.1 pilus assembly protein PilM [Jeotgalibacillus sp. HH7-29]